MDRCAVFVDAGYLFAQGSVAIAGSKKARSELVLDAATAIEKLIVFACSKAAGCRILRVYWYDGAIGGHRPTTDQALLANLDDVKLRLGFVNSHGQQKGVDSLIVTDLIELARLKSITDAVLISGDEDVRVGVQIAQNYGVRVHLLGFTPARHSQSQQLMQEADTTSEWDRVTISTFLAFRETSLVDTGPVKEAKVADGPEAVFEGTSRIGLIESKVATYCNGMTEVDVRGVKAYWESSRGVPKEHDGRMLHICSSALGRQLDQHEVRTMRSCFQRIMGARAKSMT